MKQDLFRVDGVMAISNNRGFEIQVSNSFDMARVRLVIGDERTKPSRWCNIRYKRDGAAYIRTKYRTLLIGEFTPVTNN